MALARGIDLFVHGRILAGACIDDFFKRSEADVQAALIIFGDVFMTGPASVRGIRVGWVLDNADMRFFSSPARSDRPPWHSSQPISPWFSSSANSLST